jgi:ribosomal protein S18 acetylase RimI-like enzyme
MTAALTSPTVHRDRAVATVVAAFATDPIVRWVLPDADRYLATFPDTVQLMAGRAFDAGTADVSDDHAAAALWLAPDLAPDEQGLVELTQRAVEPERVGDVFALLEQMGEHHPDEPCWYLPFIGVDPTSQGRGLGSALLRRGLERCDADHLPAYLEASSPRNRALYERHGFAVTGEIRAGDSPPLWPMWRPAR